MDKKAILVANNFVYEGYLMGYMLEPVGFEMCFNTSMTGYEEIITDPSYLGQGIVFTSPHIGNVGCNLLDRESNTSVKGIIVKAKPSKSSNFRSEEDFEKWCLKNKVFCFYGADTRSMVEKIRKNEIATGVVGYAEDLKNILEIDQKKYDTTGQDLASLSCGNEVQEIQGQGKKLAVINCGIKENIVKCLSDENFDLKIYPCKNVKNYLEDIKKADGLVLSNGPGDPRATLNNIPELSTLIKCFSEKDKPILGICLGHQIISLTHGVVVEKMPQGHRGGNQPVLDMQTNKVNITSQNHGFCATKTNLADEKYISLFDNIIEGFIFKGKRIISVQYHPEASPGPRDSRGIFKEYKNLF
ncbi:MAG: glutamine-hydrolyzing carbamoyl-phosphate synthase small subunit [Rickettsiales bacterium]|nr:MAG: glutamine-hydrolyzing carbamoyl-phosphate synthase small subunit [Rickettsiales bacterium]